MSDITIYTRDEAASIVEMFENVLDKYDIVIPSPEDEERGDDNEAKLYGSVYADLLDEVEDRLINILNLYKSCSEIVEYCFSGKFSRGLNKILKGE